jgi:hypothetical protein
MNFRYKITLLLFGILPFFSFSQKNDNPLISEILQEYLENFIADADYSDLEQTLITYYNNPLSLNTATDKQLTDLLFLTEKQVTDIIEYRIKFKGYRTIYELAAIPSMDSVTLHRLKYFTSTEESTSQLRIKPIHILTRGVNRLNIKYQQNLEQEKGYQADLTNNGYLGSPYRLMIRYSHQLSDKVSYGFIAEKDPGEELFRGSQKNGFDFYSGHFFISNQKWIKQLVIGDYHANFGQGLAFYSGMSFGKSANATGLYRYSPGLKPSMSANESNFLRGIGITSGYKNIKLTAFFSHRSIDGSGTGSDSMNQETAYFTSLTSTGYHRTNAEMAKKNNLTETLGGAHIVAGFSKLNLGFTVVGGKFSRPLLVSDQLYRLFTFEGTSFLNYGTDYSFTYKNYHLFGELGFDGKTFAGITGLNINLNSRMTASVLYRNYPKEYQAVYSNAFRENSATQNEQGIYISFNIIPAKNWSINMYLDHYSFPWLKYGVDGPSGGLDYMIDISCRPNSRFSLNGRVRYNYRELNSPENSTVLNFITSSKRYNFRLGLNFNVSKSIALLTRGEYNIYSTQEQNFSGLMLYQDIKFNMLKEKLKVYLRYAMVNSENYETRFYTFENDMPYSFSISSLYDLNLRYYLLVEYELKKYLSFWVKLSQTDYLNKTSVGSGLSETNGNKKTELKFMLQFEF